VTAPSTLWTVPHQALDKIRFLSLTDADMLGEGEQAELDIRVRHSPPDPHVLSVI